MYSAPFWFIASVIKIELCDKANVFFSSAKFCVDTSIEFGETTTRLLFSTPILLSNVSIIVTPGFCDIILNSNPLLALLLSSVPADPNINLLGFAVYKVSILTALVSCKL